MFTSASNHFGFLLKFLDKKLSHKSKGRIMYKRNAAESELQPKVNCRIKFGLGCQLLEKSIPGGIQYF